MLNNDDDGDHNVEKKKKIKPSFSFSHAHLHSFLSLSLSLVVRKNRRNTQKIVRTLSSSTTTTTARREKEGFCRSFSHSHGKVVQWQLHISFAFVNVIWLDAARVTSNFCYPTSTQSDLWSEILRRPTHSQIRRWVEYPEPREWFVASVCKRNRNRIIAVVHSF